MMSIVLLKSAYELRLPKKPLSLQGSGSSLMLLFAEAGTNLSLKHEFYTFPRLAKAL